MSTESGNGVVEVLVPQGTRFTAGDLVIGLGGVMLDPLRAMLSVSDRRDDVEASYLTITVGETSEFGEWRISLREIQDERGLDVARIDVAPVGATR
ncbi:hypothetical protein [Streptomyces sp. SID13031]|uniref:hypothetical protein n=1 Tax=Streptomyces sp. SID13031 TaxID=2706046 RepID=UPI0013C63C9E|nr:hypothetical protein [Streptomyces sp. SID13031]NEA31517.1 hypothetical protein [Streptomyces sp. SID13031]